MFSPYNSAVIRAITVARLSWSRKIHIIMLWRIVLPLRDSIKKMHFLFDEL